MATEYQYKTTSGCEIHAVFGNVKFGDLQMIKYSLHRQRVPIFTMGSADARAFARGPRSINGALIFTHLSTGGLTEILTKAGSKVFLSHDELANYSAQAAQGNTKMNEQQRRAWEASGSIGYVGYVTAAQGGGYNATNTGTSLANLNANGQGFSAFNDGVGFNNLANYGRVTEARLADQLPPFDITLIGLPEAGARGLTETENWYKPQRLIIRGVEIVSESSGTSVEDLAIEKQMAFVARTVEDWKDLTV